MAILEICVPSNSAIWFPSHSFMFTSPEGLEHKIHNNITGKRGNDAERRPDHNEQRFLLLFRVAGGRHPQESAVDKHAEGNRADDTSQKANKPADEGRQFLPARKTLKLLKFFEFGRHFSHVRLEFSGCFFRSRSFLR